MNLKWVYLIILFGINYDARMVTKNELDGVKGP